MALVHRKRLNSTLRSDNMDFVMELCENTGLNQSKIYDLSIDILRKQLNDKNIFELINENNKK
ncbi:hypothetical protein FDG50_00470 [Clostridium botulinum]|uniref:hypothetical protein n=1 Tax=Clostridium TaxID=1485 RepID=UPI0013F0EAEE|nr:MULTISPECIES: hypothetical protein [Clostridium]MBY6836004.1 hypothetical protein [Clostridium botulinum]MBY6929777.1 hypothetical protein [Clostridium botulinum]NFF21944.1 hypothetical protein [Clostridium botulinum]NFF35496.1 hypothetical protein [Clostridium botulinum]NFG65786.1 hypothetical protein [Clostridium botulinum]